ncbi:MAG: hypothetical protein QW101_05235 [Ignisphaera sp.]|uniref:Thioredoxin family protein n=1 Tax=Ignisphaera aggregans TaxID=334771 RepID=A0A7J3MZR5_9CREN
MAIEKLILVTATHMPQHKHFKKLAEELSKELKIDLEIREEDYVFVSTYGEKDEFGMSWLPQLFVVVDGEIKPALTKFPINEKTLELDYEKALKEVKEKLGL